MKTFLTAAALIAAGFVAWSLVPVGWPKLILIGIWGLGMIWCIQRSAGRAMLIAAIALGALSAAPQPAQAQTCNKLCMVGVGIAAGAAWDFIKSAWGHMNCDNYAIVGGEYQDTHWHGCFEY
jgi:hypothetical protein